MIGFQRGTPSRSGFTETPESNTATAAFAIPELLEHILLHLDFKTLLFSQRVNKTWSLSIQGSKKLQQKLFSIPATLEEAKTLGMMAEENYVLVYNEGDAYNISSADNELMGVLNTHILAYQGVNQVYDNSSVFKLTGTILKDTTSGRHKRASWERMYLSQPPMSPAYFHVSSGDQGFTSYRTRNTNSHLRM